MSLAELQKHQHQRRKLITTMALIIVAVAMGFGVVVYPWDLLRLPGTALRDLAGELLPLTAFLLLVVFFLAYVTKVTRGHEAAERRAAETGAAADGSGIEAAKARQLGQLSVDFARQVASCAADLSRRVRSLEDAMPEGTPESDRVRGLVGDVQRELGRLRGSATALSDYARPSEGQVELVQLAALVERALDVLGPDLESRGVEVQRDLAPQLPPVRCVANQLQHAVLSLLLNAARAMEPSGGLLKIGLHADADSRLRLEVIDTGCGMSPEAQSRAFEAFFSAWPQGRGPGLGLTVSRVIVRRHGGDIRLVSEPAVGTCVMVDLPPADA